MSDIFVTFLRISSSPLFGGEGSALETYLTSDSGWSKFFLMEHRYFRWKISQVQTPAWTGFEPTIYCTDDECSTTSANSPPKVKNSDKLLLKIETMQDVPLESGYKYLWILQSYENLQSDVKVQAWNLY